MTKLKRLLSYSGIFLLTMCLAAGFVILQFLFSNKNSVPELVVSAEDTTFSQVLNKVMNSDNISADFDVTVSFGGENLELAGVLELDLAKILNAGDDIIGALEVSVDCTVLSNGEILPLTIKVKEGMCYTTVANNQLKFKLTDTMQNVGTILTLIGVEIPTGDIMADFDMSNLMGLMENVTTETTENGYKILIPLFDYGTAEIIADKEYNITEINLNELSIEGVVATVQLKVETDKENFEIPVLDEEANGLDVSNLMKFVTAVSNIVSDKQVAGNLTLKTKHFENSFDFGANFNNRNYAYLTSNILGKELQVLANDDNVYLAFNDFKFKASYGEIMSVVNFVKDYIETLTNVSIEEEVQNQLDNLNQENLTISDIFEKLNIVSVDVKDILSALTFENDGNTLVFDYKGVKLVFALNENQLSTIDFSYGDYAISIDLNGTLQEIEVVDSEYVNYTFYQEIYNRIKTFVSSKKVALKTAVVLGENEYVVDIKTDLNKGFDIELKTEILDYNIKVNVLDNILYLQLNEQKVSYALKSGENLANILGGVLKTLDIENLEENAKGEVEKLTQELGEMLNQLLNITEEQVFEILSYFALNYINNNQVDTNIDNYKVSFAVANDNLLDVLVEYKDVKVLVNVSDKDWNFELNKEEYVAVDNINSVVNTVVEIVNNKQVTLTGNVTYKTLTLPVTIKADFNANYVEFNTTVLEKDICLVYTNDKVYLTVDDLKVMATTSEISSLVNMLIEVLNSNGANINVEEITTKVNEATEKISDTTLTNISILDILKTLKLTNQNKDNLTVSYNDVTVSLNQTDGKLGNINFTMPSVVANFDISTTATKKTFVDNDYVKVAEIENIYNKVKAIVDARAMNIVADVKYGDYEFKGSISLDLSDLNDPKLRIYNAYFNEYKVDITYIGNTLYAKINELKVYLAVDLDNIQDVLDKVGYAYNNFTNSNLDIPNIKAMIDDYKQMFEDILNSTEDFDFEDFMDIYNKITLNSISKFKVDGVYDNIKLIAEINGANLVDVNVEFDDVKANVSIDKKQTAIYVPDLTDYSNLNPVVDILGKVTDTFSTKKFGLSTTIEVMGEKISITGYADLSDFENGPKVFATATIANTPVYITYFEEVFYFEAKGLKMSATLSELQQLFEVDIKKFIETTLDETLKGIENDISAMLESLDILDSVVKEENGLTLCTSMGLDLTFVESASKIETIVVDYDDIGLNATLNVLGYTGTISKPSGEFTVYKNGIKLMNTFIDFVTNETFNVAISGTAASEALDFVFDIKQKDAYITSINAKGSIGTGTNLQIGYLGEEKYILVNGNKVYDYTEEQAQTNTVYTNPSFVFVDYNGLKIKLDTLLVDKIIGFVTGLFNIDLSVVYDLLNVNIPSYDMEVMQGLVTGYDTEVKLPVDENSGLEETLNLLESINLSMDGTILTVSLTDGGKAIVKTEVVDGVTRIATLELVDVAMGEDKINLLIDFYCELPSDMSSIPSRDDAAYMDLSTIGNFLETLVDTVNFKRYKIQGVATIVLGDSATLTAIDVFADIQLIKTEKSDGTYVWKPYIVAWLKNLPDSNDGIVSSIAIEKAARENDATNHQTRLYIDSNGIYVYRTVYKYVKVQTGKNWLGLPTYENVYGTHVLSKKKFGFDAFSSTDGMVDFMNTVIGLSNTMEWVIETAFKNPTTPNDYSPEKMFYNDVANNKRSYVYNGRYNLLFNGKYLLNNTAIGDLSVDIGTEVMGDGNDYLASLNFTMNASIVNIKLSDTRLIDYISHSSYPTINADIGNELAQLKNGTTSFEAYFNALAS